MDESIWQVLGSIFEDVLFPKFCVGCNHRGTWWCHTCHAQVEWLDSPLQLKLEPLLLHEVWAAARHQPPIQQLVTRLKYQSVRDLCQVAARLMFLALPRPNPSSCLTAIPLHPRRQRERGFNQAEYIARHLAAFWQLPYQPLLVRSRYTTPQAQQGSRAERLQHLQNAFRLHPNLVEARLPTRIILVDDVITTGTTLNQCAAVLTHHGVSNISAVGVSHGA